MRGRFFFKYLGFPGCLLQLVLLIRETGLQLCSGFRIWVFPALGGNFVKRANSSSVAPTEYDEKPVKNVGKRLRTYAGVGGRAGGLDNLSLKTKEAVVMKWIKKIKVIASNKLHLTLVGEGKGPSSMFDISAVFRERRNIATHCRAVEAQVIAGSYDL